MGMPAWHEVVYGKRWEDGHTYHPCQEDIAKFFFEYGSVTGFLLQEAWHDFIGIGRATDAPVRGDMFGFDLMELGLVAAVIIVIAGGLAVVVSLVRWVVHLKVMEEQLEDQLEVLSEIRKQLARVVTLLDK